VDRQDYLGEWGGEALQFFASLRSPTRSISQVGAVGPEGVPAMRQTGYIAFQTAEDATRLKQGLSGFRLWDRAIVEL